MLQKLLILACEKWPAGRIVSEFGVREESALGREEHGLVLDTIDQELNIALNHRLGSREESRTLAMAIYTEVLTPSIEDEYSLAK
jgi:hypothetical protein